MSGYISEKLDQMKELDEEIKQANNLLQSKNVNIETLNEHIQLSEELKKHRLSTKDIHKLLNLLLAVKEYKYDPGKIVAKLRSIKRLENKENRLKICCEMLSKREAKYKEIIPLANLISDLHIGRSEIISFEIALHEAIETYGLATSAAAIHVINVVKNYNKKGQLEHELSEQRIQKCAIERFCSSRSQVIMSLMNLRSHGVSEDRILQLNNFLESNGYKQSKNIPPRIRHYGEALK